VNLTCAAGTTGTYPDCRALTCADSGQQGTYPDCGACTGSHVVGVYPACVCESGYTGTPPSCTAITGPITATNLKGRFTSQYGLDIKDGWMQTVSIADSNFTQGTLYSPWGNETTIVLNSTKTSMESGSVGEGVYWGKWTSTTSDTFDYLPANITPTIHNFWVAGTPTDEAYLDSLTNAPSTLTTYTYTGKILGAVYNDTTHQYQDILPSDTTNEVILAFNFGGGYRSMDITQSSLKFTPQGGSLWNLSFASSGQVGTERFSASFSGNLGSLSGYFYGTNAQALGGSFKASDLISQEVAYGVFSGSTPGGTNRSIASSVLGGFATSSYYSGTEQFSQSWIDILPVNINTILGGIQLIRNGDTTELSLNNGDSIYTSNNDFSIEYFGPDREAHLQTVALPSGISTTMTWGNWTSAELGGGSTLIATSDNFWVAGKPLTSSAYIGGLSGQQYTYNGKVLGAVVDLSGASTPIDPSDAGNAVRFVFDFGDSLPINITDSFIRFNGWNLAPKNDSYVDTNQFFGGIEDIGMALTGGAFSGQFYDTYAESIGGGFWASDDVNGTATGVFVGAKNDFYPATLDAAISQTTDAEVSLSMKGYATGSRLDLGVLYTDGGAALDMNWTNPGVPSVGGQIHTIAMTQSTDANLTYNQASKTIAIKDFDGANQSYLLTGTRPYGTLSLDYLSWGYWSAKGQDPEDLLPLKHYWVAGLGSEIDAAKAYLDPLKEDLITTTTLLRYEGSIYGHKVDQGQNIYPLSAGSIKLDFELGSGSDTLFIRTGALYVEALGLGYNLYATSGYGVPTSNVIDTATGSFSLEIDGYNHSTYHSGFLTGYFYGAAAQELGGTFYANDITNHHVNLEGVFLSKKTVEASVPMWMHVGYNSLGNEALRVADSNSSMAHKTLTGLATAWYLDGNTTAHSIGYGVTVDLDVNATGRTGYLKITNDANVALFDYSMYEASGTDETNGSTLTIQSSNAFILQDGNTAIFYTDASEPNDYVSWGYWGTKYPEFEKAIASKNYWVAGKDAAAAATYIAGLTGITQYTYSGKVLGSVIENGTMYDIDTAASNVSLKFDVGSTKAIIPAESSISFATISTSPSNRNWVLSPGTASISIGKFTGTLTGTGGVDTVTTGAINGQFFGANAEGVGGTLKAIAGSSTALGVFKAVK
jgi:hypothetical protein